MRKITEKPQKTARKDKRGAPKSSFGNVAHEPTEEIRKRVSDLTSYGVPQVQIAAVLDISVDTLQRHYRTELDTAVIVANERVSKRMYALACDPDHPDHFKAMKYWLGARAGWKEAAAVEHSGPNGGDIPTVVRVEYVGVPGDTDS